MTDETIAIYRIKLEMLGWHHPSGGEAGIELDTPLPCFQVWVDDHLVYLSTDAVAAVDFASKYATALGHPSRDFAIEDFPQGKRPAIIRAKATVA